MSELRTFPFTAQAARIRGLLGAALLLTLPVVVALAGCGPATLEGDERMEERAADTDTSQEAVSTFVNAARYKSVTAQGDVTGSLFLLTDDVSAPEGTLWNDPNYAIQIPDGTSLTVDLEATYTIERLSIQADNNDVYTIEGSTNGNTWYFMHAFSHSNGGPGLRTRPPVALSTKSKARYLRVSASSGDGLNSVSELQAFVFGEDCNHKVCTGATFCCNYSCSICVPSYSALCWQGVCND
jgi:hypothetical protein